MKTHEDLDVWEKIGLGGYRYSRNNKDFSRGGKIRVSQLHRINSLSKKEKE